MESVRQRLSRIITDNIIDILCFQETKLRGDKLQGVQHLLWQGAEFFGIEARMGYNNDHNANGAGSGGVCMWISPKLVHLIGEKGKDVEGHVQ